MSKKKAYVIGTNVRESLSPLIFNYWFEKGSIKGEYIFKEIEPKNFDQEIDIILNEKNVCGFNVTIPYKERIIKKLDSIDEHSKIIFNGRRIKKVKIPVKDLYQSIMKSNK